MFTMTNIQKQKENRFFESKSFRKLSDDWYSKLKTEGFNDIEHSEDSPYLKDHNIRDAKAVGRDELSLDSAYYRKASEFYWQYSFNLEYDKYVWKCHIEGLSIRSTVKALSIHPNDKWHTSRFVVHESIKRSKELLREWESNEQEEKQYKDIW